MSNKAFFDEIRHTVFGGSMTQQQVAGVTKIIDYRDQCYRGVTNDQLAYILATTFHETARKMAPVKEYGGAAYLNSKPYKEKYCGRGLVQITWAANYRKYGISNPEDALSWPVALHVLFDGFVRGQFTGKRLSDYVSGSHIDYIGCRRCINGTDRASLIAGYARSFQHAMRLWQPSVRTPAPRVATAQKGFFEEIGDKIGGFFGGGEEKAAAPGAPMPPPMPPALTGEKAYILSAVIAAVGALQVIPWDEVIRNPSVGYSLVWTAVFTAVVRAVVPSGLQWIILR